MELSPQMLEDYFDRLWPICRSITGKGFKDSLNILSEIIPLEKHYWNSGEKVLDWVIPDEWNITEGYVERVRDRKMILNFRDNNLHVVGYSQPFLGRYKWRTLRDHVHTVPQLPDAIPYITSYYKRTWGFCMSYNQYLELERDPEAEYYFCIDSTLGPGELIVGDLLLPGKTDREIFLTSYLCHPSLAINELSGPLTLAGIYLRLKELDLNHTIRFYVGPENIGAVAYLSRFGWDLLNKVKAGYVINCTGHPIEEGDLPAYNYKRSRRGDSLADRVALHVLEERAKGYVWDTAFFPDGSDERQWCSPGYNLPMGLIMREMYGNYPEYHTSLDNKSLIDFESIMEMIDAYVEVIQTIDVAEKRYICRVQGGTPMFSKYPGNLYQSTMQLNNFNRPTQHRKILLDLANYSDWTMTLLDIAERCGHRVLDMIPVVKEMIGAELLEEDI